MTLGDCFFTPETATVRRHLWIIVTDPTKSTSVAIVNLSSRPNPVSQPSDPPQGVVAVGEHPAISHDSFLRCEEARLVEIAHLEQLFRGGKLKPARAASAALVTKTQTVLGASKETKLEVKEHLRAQGFIP